MLSKKQLKDICLLNSGDYQKCRYLDQDENDYTKYYCLKQTSKAKQIDIDLNDFVSNAQKKGKDPYKENIAMGNNCQGYPFLRHIEQGYDKT